MQFLVLGYDGQDEGALDRRMAARTDHIAMGDEAIQRGEQIMGVAMLDEQQKMIGSAMVVEFESREKLDEWLEKEPYVVGKVWEKIEVVSCKVGPSFEK